MPVIIVKARETEIDTREKKSALIEALSDAYARVAGDTEYKDQAMVVIETFPEENWGRGGGKPLP